MGVDLKVELQVSNAVLAAALKSFCQGSSSLACKEQKQNAEEKVTLLDEQCLKVPDKAFSRTDRPECE